MRLRPGQRKLALVALVCLTGTFAYLTADDSDRAAVAAGLRNPMSVLAARSPGARDGGALYQTKRRLAGAQRARPARVGPAPRERVLSQERTRPPAALPPLQIGDVGPDALLLGAPDNLFTAPGVPESGFGPGFDVPPFAFGDGPQVVVTPGQPEPPPGPGPAVPELATWLMMMTGLSLAGLALRRRGRLPIVSAAA